MSTAGSFNLTVALPSCTNHVKNFSMLSFSCKKKLANVSDGKILCYNIRWGGTIIQRVIHCLNKCKQEYCKHFNLFVNMKVYIFTELWPFKSEVGASEEHLKAAFTLYTLYIQNSVCVYIKIITHTHTHIIWTGFMTWWLFTFLLLLNAL